MCLPRRTKRKCAAIKKDASVLTFAVDVVKRVVATVLLKLRCISYRMYTFRVKCVRVSDIIAKRLKYGLKGKILPIFSICESKRHYSFSKIFHGLSENCRRFMMWDSGILNSVNRRRRYLVGKHNGLSLQVNFINVQMGKRFIFWMNLRLACIQMILTVFSPYYNVSSTMAILSSRSEEHPSELQSRG